MKTLSALAQWLDRAWSPAERADDLLTHLTDVSGEVRPGGVFVAVAGGRYHGLDFVEEAVARGVRLVLSDRAPETRLSVPVWVVPTLHARRAALARWFYDAPDERVRVVGVTGTNGKSSTVWYLAQLLESVGVPTGVIGTLGWGRFPHLEPAGNTTPGVVTLYAMLDALAQSGAGVVAMEVSSHAIVQARIAGIRFEGVALTQVTRDHLDFHGSEAAYREAKQRLFTDFPSRWRVVNLDDAVGRAVAERMPVIGYGQVPTAHWRLTRLVADADGLSGQWQHDGRTLAWHTPLLGLFNAENLTCAAAMATALTGDVAWLPTVARLQPVTGRMMRVARRPVVIIDYAHTPDALAQLLQSVRCHYPDRRLIVVFGAGGDRDAGKRPLMGAAAEAADRIVLTSDNPRCEPPDQILQQVAAGIRQTPFKVIPDRARAIQTAIQCARDEDVVVIAGKGHESEQIFCHETRPFSDRDEALKWTRD